MNATKKLILGVLVVMVVALPLGAIAVYHWQQRVYSDGDALRRNAGNESPRDVLWQAPRTIPELAAIPGEIYEPRLSWDGLTLYFVRGKAGANADIFSSRRTAQGWSEPQPLTDINTDADELGPEPSADGNTLYFYSDRAGGRGGYDLWVARRGVDSDGTESWQTPENLGPTVNSEFNDYGPAIANDGRTLFFASNRPQPGDTRQPDAQAWPATVREDSFRRTYDLYQAELTSDGPGAATPIVALNTPANEGAPCISPAGDFLYFASDRSGGLGGFDLYRARVIHGVPQTPENLGPTINSPWNELDPGLAQLGFALYFSSDRNAAVNSGSTSEKRYQVYYTSSREVFLDQEPLDWAALWRAAWPVLAWLALALLAGLLLRQLIKDIRDGRLSLLARCLLASVLLHCLLLMGLGYWKVRAAVGEFLGGRGKVKVMLAASGVGGDLMAQVRGNLVSPGAMPEPAKAEPPRVVSAVNLLDPSPARVEAAPTATPVHESLIDNSTPHEIQPSDARPLPQVSDSMVRLALNRPEFVPATPSPESESAQPRPEKEVTAPSLPALIPKSSPITPLRPVAASDVTISAPAIGAIDNASIPEAVPVAHSFGSALDLPGSLSASTMNLATPRPKEPGSAPEHEAGAPPGPAVGVRDVGPIHIPSTPVANAPQTQTIAPQPSVGGAGASLIANARAIAPDHKPVAMPPVPTSAPAIPEEPGHYLTLALPQAASASAANSESARGESGSDVKPIEVSTLPRPESGHGSIPDVAARAIVTAPAVATASARNFALAGDAQPEIPDLPTDRDRGASAIVPPRSDTPLGKLLLGLPAPLPIEAASPATPGAAATDAGSLPTAGSKQPQQGPAKGVLRGVVSDAKSGQPLANATIRFDQAQGEPLTTITDSDGSYRLAVAETPDNFAVTASHEGYLPESRNMRESDVRGRTSQLDFALAPENENVIAVEDEPVVHHLGNDLFEGRINSQFQRKSEGVTLLGDFAVSEQQTPATLSRAAVSMMVKGIQCPHEVRINGTLLTRRLDRSPANGSFGEMVLPFNPELLHAGENQISVTAVSCNGDLDDFEFVNVQIRLTKKE